MLTRPESYPESGFCSGCRDHTVFVQDEETGEWLSVCCGQRAEPVDMEDDRE